MIEPLLLKLAIRSTPAAESAVLRLSIELTLPAPATLLMVSVVVPAAVLKISVSPCSEFVPALVRSVAVPGTASAPAPVGAAMVTLAFDDIARGRLQHLVGDRLRGIDQLLERGDAGVGGLQDLHAIADAVEQVVDVAGAGIEAGAVKKLVGLSSARVDLLAGGETVLGGREQIGGALQREQVLANRGRELMSDKDMRTPFWRNLQPAFLGQRMREP